MQFGVGGLPFARCDELRAETEQGELAVEQEHASEAATVEATVRRQWRVAVVTHARDFEVAADAPAAPQNHFHADVGAALNDAQAVVAACAREVDADAPRALSIWPARRRPRSNRIWLPPHQLSVPRWPPSRLLRPPDCHSSCLLLGIIISDF